MPLKTNLDQSTVVPPVLVQRLPSMGWPYREEHPEFPNEVTVKPLSFNTHAILVTNLTSEEKMEAIVTEVAQFATPIEASKLLIQDQYFILAIARSLTFGDQYSFSAACQNPRCDHVEQAKIKVPDEVPIKWWEFKTKTEWEKHVTIVLPLCKDKIILVFPTGDSTKAHEKATELGMAANPQEVPGRLAYLNRIASQIKSVNGGAPTNLDEARNYVRRLVGPDYDALDTAIDERRCGITFLYDIKCDKCGTAYKTEIPIRDHFFRRE